MIGAWRRTCVLSVQFVLTHLISYTTSIVLTEAAAAQSPLICPIDDLSVLAHSSTVERELIGYNFWKATAFPLAHHLYSSKSPAVPPYPCFSLILKCSVLYCTVYQSFDLCIQTPFSQLGATLILPRFLSSRGFGEDCALWGTVINVRSSVQCESTSIVRSTAKRDLQVRLGSGWALQ